MLSFFLKFGLGSHEGVFSNCSCAHIAHILYDHEEETVFQQWTAMIGEKVYVCRLRYSYNKNSI